MITYKICLPNSDVCSIDASFLLGGGESNPNDFFTLKTKDGDEITIAYETIERILAIVKAEKNKHGRK